MSNSSVPESEPEAGGSPTPEEILLPPILLTVVGVLCFVVLFLVTRGSTLCQRKNRTTPTSSRQQIFVNSLDSHLEEESDIIEDFKCFQNKLRDLAYILIHPVVTMLFCPMTLFLHRQLTSYFWSHMTTAPNVNDAIGCFLMPAGMVYAITFAYAIEQVKGQQDALADSLQKEVTAARQIVLLICQMSNVSNKQKFSICKILMTNCLNRMQHIQRNTIDKTINVWNIVNHLPNHDKANMSYTDNLICKQVVQKVGLLSDLIPEAGTLHTTMNKFQWLLLESLGFFSFLGILLIQAQSYKLELAMCIVTVFSITLLTAAVSDLDSPFHGFYRIDLEFMTDFAAELQSFRSEYTPKGEKDIIC